MAEQIPERKLQAAQNASFVTVVLGLLALVLALWGGLIRIGWWHYSLTIPGLPGIHGPLVVCGFLGTFFSLERAISLKYGWGYLIPLTIAIGALSLVANPLWKGSRIIVAIGSFGFLSLCLMSLQKQINFFNSMIALGSVFWLSGMIIWWVDWPVFNIYLWWMGFVLFTLVGQRLELAHRVHLTPKPFALLGMALAFVLLGQLLMAVGRQAGPESQATVVLDAIHDPRLTLGMRLAGAGMIGAALWLLRYDAAWSLIGNGGMARYIGVCLLSSYLWLAVSGVFSIFYAGFVSGTKYDALIHSFFVGFVLFAIFGHTPSMLLSALGIRFTRIDSFYIHVVLLHAALLIRIGADLFYHQTLKKWGGMLNTVAILLFLGATGFWILTEYRREVRDGRENSPC